MLFRSGHTQCGAIEAAIESATSSGGAPSRNLLSIVERIRPSIQVLLETDLAQQPAELRRKAVRANVRSSVNHLIHGSAMLEEKIFRKELFVTGAEYILETGEVNFLES